MSNFVHWVNLESMISITLDVHDRYFISDYFTIEYIVFKEKGSQKLHSKSI